MPETFLFDGFTGPQLAQVLGLPRVELLQRTSSTLDVAHRLGSEGAPAGTLVLADEQTAGRGRSGGVWTAPSGIGIWLTLLERPLDTSGLDVLSIRVGLLAARAIDRFASEPIRLKWPNDLYVDDRKLAGILIEARWRDQRVEWVAVGLGVNVVAPADLEFAAGLDSGTSRIAVLMDLIPALREAAYSGGELTAAELEEWKGRDLAQGRTCIEPARGRVRGITPRGELVVELADTAARFRMGSLVLNSVR